MAKASKLREVKANVDFVQMEKDIMNLWNEKSIVKKYLEKNNKSKKNFSFIDGPITANNPMGVHHAWARTYKDVVQRYKNMQGFEQRFQNGFDCQGLWVEVGVERDLGFNSKKDILDYGMDNFTNACVARVNKFSKIQTEQSERLGMFMDWDNSYYTMSETNNLYIWHFLKKCQEKGLLYKDKSATTWCPRCETGLSQHEQADGYKMIKDTAVYVLFKITGRKNEYVLAWTTTPWTLAANVLLAVNPELEYVKTNYDGKTVYLGADAAKRMNMKDVESVDVKEILGLEYDSLFEIDAQKNISHSIVSWNLVDSSTGSGVVHIAPGCGQEDFELGLELKADTLAPLDSTGRFLEGYGDLTGKYAHDVAPEVLKYLESKNLLFKTEEYEHSYPHCWRCGTKCLFRLEDNWFLDVRSIKEDLKKASETVKWNPEYVGKRMLGWLDGMGDWMISRKRFYGLALPFYECKKCGNLHVVGSKEELKKLALEPKLVDDLPSVHRPWIDDIKIKCPKCGEEVERVADVGDCWLDAGVVPFSTLKYLEDRGYWEKWFPADFITEMIEQVRLWFYSMLVFGVVLEKQIPYREVLGFAEVRDENNERMSKSKPTYIKFDEAAEKVGSDILRWNYVTSSVGANIRFSWNGLEDVRRRFYLPLWNSYNYFVTYAKLHNWDNSKYDATALTNVMDRWIVSKVRKLAMDVEKLMDRYDMANASRNMEDFVKDLSQWYIRRSRNRFKVGDSDALGTLHYCLVLFSQISAPMIPFVDEEMYQNLVVGLDLKDAKLSVHLEEYPKFMGKDIDEEILSKMDTVRTVCSNGLKAREDAKLNLRQPLSVAFMGIDDVVMNEIVKEELNVKEVKFSKEKIQEEGFISAGEGTMYVSIDVRMSDDLKEEGLRNEFLRKYRDMRKKGGFKIDDVVTLHLKFEDSDQQVSLQKYLEKNHTEMSVKDILVSEDGVEYTNEIVLNGKKIFIKID